MSEESAKPLESILNRAVEEKKQQVKGSLEARLKKSWEWNNFDQKGGKGEGASKGKDIPHPGPAPSMKWWKLCLGACAGSQEWDWGEIWFAIKTFDILNKGILLSQKKLAFQSSFICSRKAKIIGPGVWSDDHQALVFSGALNLFTGSVFMVGQSPMKSTSMYSFNPTHFLWLWF